MTMTPLRIPNSAPEADAAAARLRAVLGDLPETVAADVASVLERLSAVEGTLTDLELVHTITVEASTALENDLLVRNELVAGFLANTSHEIRTPLNGIIGQAELLMEELEDKGITEHQSDLERIRTAGRHLLAVVNDILDLSKVEAGQLEFRVSEFDLGDEIKDAAQSCAMLARRNCVEVSLDLEPRMRVRGDAFRVRQCVLNLLSNACKFTRGGTVTIRAWLERHRAGDRVFVAVEDTGIGLSPADLERVFEPYHQAHGTESRVQRGTGLGLSFTRSLCRRMGGDVVARSTLGAGSTFTMRLPAQVRE